MEEFIQLCIKMHRTVHDLYFSTALVAINYDGVHLLLDSGENNFKALFGDGEMSDVEYSDGSHATRHSVNIDGVEFFALSEKTKKEEN